MKKRFHILRNPFYVHKAEEIDHIFRACAVLHNILLKHDEYDTIGHRSTDWKQAVKQADHDMYPPSVRAPSNLRKVFSELESDFDSFRHKLIRHFDLEYKASRLLWTRPASMIRPREDMVTDQAAFDEAASPYYDS